MCCGRWKISDRDFCTALIRGANVDHARLSSQKNSHCGLGSPSHPLGLQAKQSEPTLLRAHPSSFVCQACYQQPCEKAQALSAHACVLHSLFCRIFLYVSSSSTPCTMQFWACAAWCSSKLPSSKIKKLRVNMKGVYIWYLTCLYGIEDAMF